ncbi:MAG: hypothetical protein AAF362_00880 [Pseudomonadota bacterium]
MAFKDIRTHGVGAAKQYKVTAGQVEEDLLGSVSDVIKPTPDAVVIDLRGDSRFAQSVSGQTLAGSGALVFEGEVLENLNRTF